MRRPTIVIIPLLAAVVRCQLNVASPWDKTVLRLRANETGGAEEYVPDNNLAFRLRVWADTAYVAVPRFRDGVPATLCSTPVRGDGDALRPYPSPGLQTPDNCIGLQNAVDIELDHLGRLWTLDRGRAAGANRTGCDPKLFVVDTGTGRVVRSAVMPTAVYAAGLGGGVLSGLAIDLKTLTAVVADLRPDGAAFVAYDFRSGVYGRFRCAALERRSRARGRDGNGGGGGDDQTADDDQAANDDRTGLGGGGDGGGEDPRDPDYDEAVMAASPIDDQLYFTAVGLRAVYAIPLSVFQAPQLRGRDVSHYASARGPLDGTATACVMDAAGTLYVAVRPGHKVMAWNTLRAGGFGTAEPAVLEVRLDWVSGLALDARGYMWIVTSAFREFARAGAAANARIFRRYCGVTAFALQEAAAANVTAAADGDVTAATAAGAGRDAGAAVAVPTAGPAAALVWCAATAAALSRRIACET